MLALVLVNINVHTKFEVPMFSHSKDVIAYSRHVCQGWFVIRMLGFALHAKFEVSNFTHYKDIKGNTKCTKSDGL